MQATNGQLLQTMEQGQQMGISYNTYERSFSKPQELFKAHLPNFNISSPLMPKHFAKLTKTLLPAVLPNLDSRIAVTSL